MFADSFCDSHLDRRSRRGWTTLVSFALQALAVGGLLALPFLSIQGLQELPFVTHLMAPVSQAAAPAHTQQAPNTAAATRHSVFIYSDHMQNALPMTDEGDPLPPNLPIGQSNTSGTGFPVGIADSTGTAPPVLATIPVAHPPRVSVMMEGNLIHRVQPQYPPMAIQTHTQGTVVLRAVISREGNIENLQLLSGHPMLVKAAMDAVRQWRYQPYYLNHEPVEVDTQITVNFVLGSR